jgi:hypothetical protein
MTGMIARRLAIAEALQNAMPGLANPEAWPWLTMADAAL